MQTSLHCKVCAQDGMCPAAVLSSPQGRASPQTPGPPSVAGHLPGQSPVFTADYRDSLHFPTAFSQGAVAVHTLPSTGFHLVCSETCRTQQKEALGRSRERCGGGRQFPEGAGGQARLQNSTLRHLRMSTLKKPIQLVCCTASPTPCGTNPRHHPQDPQALLTENTVGNSVQMPFNIGKSGNDSVYLLTS